MFLVPLAHALPPCLPDDVNLVDRVDEHLFRIRPDLVALVPDLPTLDDTAVAWAKEDGSWVIRRSTFEPTCTDPGGDLAVQQRWPLQSGGNTSIFTGHGPILVIGSKGDRSEERWHGILAHEWTHVQHARALGDAFPSIERLPLEKRFLKNKRFKEAVLTLARAIDTTCDDGVADAYGIYREAVPKKHRHTSDDYLMIEGFARYFEKAYEGRVRGSTDPVQTADCRGTVGGAYGYAVGCMLAVHLEACRPGWQARALDVGLPETLSGATP